MFVQYIVGPDYLSRPGDERLCPLWLCLFTLGWSSALLAWHALAAQPLTVPPAPTRAPWESYGVERGLLPAPLGGGRRCHSRRA